MESRAAKQRIADGLGFLLGGSAWGAVAAATALLPACSRGRVSARGLAEDMAFRERWGGENRLFLRPD